MPPSPRRSPPVAITPERLRARLLAYLQGRATTVAHARRLYGRKVDEAVAQGADRAALVAALEDALAAAVRLGLVDDARYAELRARRGLARGTAPARVAAALAAKGVAPATARAGLSAAVEGDPVKVAAAAYVRRRRLGHWRPAADRAAAHADDLARLARAGFPYAVARAALAGEPDADDDRD